MVLLGRIKVLIMHQNNIGPSLLVPLNYLPKVNGSCNGEGSAVVEAHSVDVAVVADPPQVL